MTEMPGSEQVCRNCDRVISPQARRCSCGVPTALATFKERTEWEVKQWRATRSSTRALNRSS